MSKLDFNVTSTGDCSRIKISDCSTFCVSTSYTATYLRARVIPIDIEWSQANFTKDFWHASATTGTITGLSYTIVNSAGTTSAVISLGSGTNPTLFPIFPITMVEGINTITFTVTDNQSIGNSTTTVVVNLDSTGTVVWNYFPFVNQDVTNVLNNRVVGFTENDSTTLTDTEVTSRTFTDTDSTSFTFSASGDTDSHTYSAAGTYTQTYTVVTVTDVQTITSVYRLKITGAAGTCADEMTQTDITSVILTITDPNDIVYDPVTITSNYTNFVPFYLYPEDDMEDLADFSTPGKWKFELKVTKTVDGTTYILTQCIYVYLICDLLCKYGKALLALGNKEDCDCTDLSTEQLIQMGAYMDGLKNAIACNNQTQADRIIDVLEILLANSGCGC